VLSKKQQRIAENSGGVPRRRVKGGAGSGKTIALAARAAALSGDSDRRTLVICYNRSLVTYLRDTIAMFVRSEGGDRKTITIRHWDGWWKDARKVLGLPFSGSPESQGSVARSVLEGDAAKLLPHYDAVLVDEAQDLTPDQIAALASVLQSSRSEILLCFDNAQDVFSKRGEWSRGAFSQLEFREAAIHLTESRRMPPRLATIANGFARHFLEVAEGDLLQVPDTETFDEHRDVMTWIQCDEWDLVPVALAEISALFDSSGQTSRDRVAWVDLVVAARTRERAFAMSAALEQQGLPVLCAVAGKTGSTEDQNAKSNFYKGRGRLKVSTIKSLKGFETSTMIVVIDAIPTVGADAALREVYTAITRLKGREGGSSLTVVCAEPSLARFGEFFNHVSLNVS
jgi:superfamily I DNA and RNA helicase